MHNPFSTYSDTRIMHNPGLCKMCATDLQRSGAAWSGQEVSSSFALAARAARSQYIKKLATNGGSGAGGLTATIATVKIGPGFESPKPGYNYFWWSIVQKMIPPKKGG